MARPAPFGWRDETRVDPRVRNTWEIAPAKVKVDGRRWNKTLRPQLERIQEELGLPAAGKLTARLDKLLVYEPGQFFAAHQDSEKRDDMVGTLVAVLPSACTGGAATIEHRGERVT
ncbi:MAG: hypothetical protein AB7N76_21560 [Planctomycetota bacterium]